MDADRLSTKVFAGYGRAAKRVGQLVQIYRPRSAREALSEANLAGEINAAFTVHNSRNFNFEMPSDYDKPLYHILANASLLRVGDYLRDPEHRVGTFFIASITPAMPPLGVSCNLIISIKKPGPAPAVGLSGYSGTTTANEEPILTSWPASVIRRQVMREQYLPQDVGVGSFQILIPAFENIVIRPGMLVSDNYGSRYAISMAERQDLGWRLEAQRAQT